MNKDNRNAQLNELYKFQYGKGNTIEGIGGEYPIYGSNGQVGFTNVFNSEDAPIIGHIGAYAGIVNWAYGKHYVTYNGVICKIKNGINPRFGYYTLLVSNLRNRLRGSTQPFVSYDLLNDVKVYLPERKTQDNIAKVLSDLDAKIEINNKINSVLEGIAKTIYNYWFVQFDFPDENGKPYKTSAGKMIYNDVLKREIPEGWIVKSLDKIAEIKRGKLVTAKTANLKGNIKVISAGINYSYMHSISNREANTITISGSGANAGYINFWREPIFACDCTTVRGKSDAMTLILLGFLNMRQDYIFSQARGSAQPHVYPKDISVLKMALPDENLINKYGDLALSGNKKIANNLKENQKLADLRDWLLPMLMNGQVTVKEAKEQYK